MKREHKIVLGVGFGLLTIGMGIGSFGYNRAEADASARRFLNLLSAGDYGLARDTLSHFKRPPSVEFLEFWWSECTHSADRSMHLELTKSFLKLSIISSTSSARLTYSIGAKGSAVPLFVTVEHREKEWIVTDFSCPMTRAGFERMKAFLHQIAETTPHGIETYWYARFDAKRTNGEWFALAPEDVRAFKKRKSFMQSAGCAAAAQLLVGSDKARGDGLAYRRRQRDYSSSAPAGAGARWRKVVHAVLAAQPESVSPTMERPERTAFRLWLGLGSVDDIDRWAEGVISSSTEHCSAAYDILEADREIKAELFLDFVRTQLGFDPVSNAGATFAEEALLELCDRVLDRSLALPAFCDFIQKLDAAFMMPADRGISFPDGLADLWNACDWCDGKWTLDNQPAVADEINAVRRSLVARRAEGAG